MTDQNSERDQFDSNAVAFKPIFVVLMCSLGVFTLLLQVVLFLFMPEGSWSIGKSTIAPPGRRVVYWNNTGGVLPGNAAVWKDEVWVAVAPGSVSTPGIAGPVAATARLMAIDLITGKPRETELSLSPAPVGMVVVDDQLWAVAAHSVCRVDKGQIIQRSPRRGLNQPTKPFVYEGRLAVIDKDPKNIYTLLTWKDGEWQDAGEVEMPDAPVAGLPNSELRVCSDGKSTYLIFWNGSSFQYREGLRFVTEPKPASALEPENSRQAELLASIAAAGNRRGPWQPPPPTQLGPGWKWTSFAAGWNQTWEFAIIQDELYAFIASGNGTGVQQYKYSRGAWTNSPVVIPATTATMSVAGGPRGYLVSDDLRLFATDGTKIVEHVTTGVKLTDNLRYVIFLSAFLIRYLIAMGVLMLGTTRLMSVYRSPNYLYGKREAIQASVLRRGIARGIDSLVTVYPPLFWFLYALNMHPDLNWSFGMAGQEGLFFFSLYSIFGVWVGGILVLSFAQGRWGVTPGKWLCGIRTFRTTMRPCGMLRSVARELVVYADSLLLVTWLPGVLSIAFTKNWQRLGDLAADTIVVVDPKRRSWLP